VVVSDGVGGSVEQRLASSVAGTRGRECVLCEGGSQRGGKGWLKGWVRLGDRRWGGEVVEAWVRTRRGGRTAKGGRPTRRAGSGGGGGGGKGG
jgi:hypothetical protein